MTKPSEPLQASFQVNPDLTEPPQAEIIGEALGRDGKRVLELRVKIEGRDRNIWLALDALEGHGLSGPAAVEELREIRKILASGAEHLCRHVSDIAGSVREKRSL